MPTRTIEIELDPIAGTGKIIVRQFEDRALETVWIGASAKDGFYVRGAARQQHCTTIEQAFRAALRAATDRVYEDLLG